MTRFEFGDIVLVPFPFTDQSATKKRPAVVVSSQAYNTMRPDLIIQAVTSQIGTSNTFGEVVVNQWQQAGLLKPSAIKPVITTIEKSIVIKPMGRLTPQDREALVECLKSILG
ncbi:MAG TPA: type II toxin-antitoxin system PemK/MazF family toxin [Acidiferrobacterales bacterium]|nr:type II toxin-antitoxin system PemK/MazF family toxin [Acidiferrobacterales bacterium]